MPFPLIEFNLTDEQFEKLKPFGEQIESGEHATVVAEIIVHSGNHNLKRVVARLYDQVAMSAVSAVVVKAQNDYDERRARALRLKGLQVALTASNTVTSLADDVLVIRRDGYEYELRETKQPTHLSVEKGSGE